MFRHLEECHIRWFAESSRVGDSPTLVGTEPDTERAAPLPERPLILDRKTGDQRLENWKLRRALRLPYFLRSTTRLSRVRNPAALSDGRKLGS